MEFTAHKVCFLPYSEMVYNIPYGKGSGGESSESDVSLCCYPNPMHSSTTISFSPHSEGAENATIKIYNIKGQLVKRFGDLTGKAKVIWSGQDNEGRELSNGIYFYRMETDKYKSEIRKMVLLR